MLIVLLLDIQQLMQSMPITTVRILLIQDVIDTTLCDQVCHGDLRQIGGLLRFPPPIKLTVMMKLKYC